MQLTSRNARRTPVRCRETRVQHRAFHCFQSGAAVETTRLRPSKFVRRSAVVLVAFVAFSLMFATRLLTQSTLKPPTSGAWAVSGLMTQARAGASAALLVDGRLLVTGGSKGGGPISAADLFSPEGFFSRVPPMIMARRGRVSVIFIRGRVPCGGGRRS